MKGLLKWIGVLLACVLACVVLYETASRMRRPQIYQGDAVLGWTLKPNVRADLKMADASGKIYDVPFATDENGMRYYGKASPGALKILVLGDSFTADPYAGNEAMWFSVLGSELERSLHREIFVGAAGGGGYGTYQELLLAERLAKAISPDILVLQFCANDFFNNHMAWESSGVVAMQFLRRPYYTESGPQFVAGPLAGFYRSPIGRSRLFARVAGMREARGYRQYGDYVPPLDPALSRRYQDESIAITATLLARLRGTFPSSRAFLVNCSLDTSGTLAPNRFFADIANEAGFIVLTSPTEAVAEAEERGLIVRAADGGHLNPAGNAVFGKAVALGIAESP